MPASIVTIPDDYQFGVTPSKPKAQIVTLDPNYQFAPTPTDKDDSVLGFKKAKPGQSHFGLENPVSPEQVHQFLGVLPAIGGILGGIPGAAAGAAARQAIAPNPSLEEGGMDALTQGIIPEGIGKLLGPLKGFTGKIASKMVNSSNPTVADALGKTASEFQQPLSSTLDTANSAAEQVPSNIPAPGKFVKGKGIVPIETANPNPTILDDYNAGKTPQQVAKKLVSDPREVAKLNEATGNPYASQQLALTHVVNQGYNAESKVFDPDKILSELGGDNKEGYNAALLPDTKQRLSDFLTTAKSLETSKAPQGTMGYIKHRFVFDAGLALGGGLIGHGAGLGGLPALAAGGGTLVLGNLAVNKLMSSEMLGNLALQSLKLAPDSPVSPIVAKTLLSGLRGTELFLRSADGKKEQKVTPDQNGQIVPLK